MKMKYEMLDILACPMDKKHPLELIVLEEGWRENRTKDGDLIRWLEIRTGVLYCGSCGRWYPIADEIPTMLPDDLRKREEDLRFLERYRGQLPDKITSGGKPFNLRE
jgi:uncharacterized protein YbaR (Trm112 family)